MLSIFKSFKASVPNLGALRLAYLLLICLPVIWMHDEAGYALWQEKQFEMYEYELNYYKFSINAGKDSSCLVSLTDLDNRTAFILAQKANIAQSDSKLIDRGRSKIGLRDDVACNGVPDNRVFLIPYLATQLEHRADYAMMALIHWVARFIYMYLMFMAISNVFNRRYARPENMVLQQQMMKYIEYKNPKKEKRKNKKTLKSKKDLKSKK